MQVVCSVDGIEADYEIVPQIDGNKKCLIYLKNQKHKLNLKQVSAGEGFAQFFYLYKQGPGRTNRWESRMTLVGENPVEWTSIEFGSGGESIQITLGEKSKLFPCSGFVRGNLEGTIRAPALHLKMMGKDIWMFFLYFETDESRSYSIQCEKTSLVVVNGSTSASTTISAVDGNPPKILATLTSNGTDYKEIRLVLDRAVGKDSLQDSIQQELTVLNKEENGYTQADWAPVKRDGVEVLWIFSSTGFLSHRSPLKDLLEALGAKVNRSVFADNLGGNEMDDFIIADDPTMAYQIGLVLEYGSKLEVNDWTALKFAETTS
jgi:hypothetical protein